MAKRSKRGNGEGTLIKVGDRYKGAVTMGHDASGRQVRRYFTAATLEEGRAKLRELIASRSGVTDLNAHRVTVAEYLDRWLASKERTVRTTTIQGYEYLVRRHLKPRIGSLKLIAVTALKVEQLVADMLRAGESPYLTKGSLGLLKGAFKQAVIWQLIPVNPAEYVRPPEIPHKEMRVWTPDEAIRFLEATRDDKLYPLWYLALSTGMRKGELLALRWENVDLTEGFLRVVEAATRVRGGIKLGEPKTRAGRRKVYLASDVTAILKDHRVNQALELGRHATLVYVDSHGGHLWPRNVTREFHRAAEGAGVPRIRFHDLRHTAASLLIRHGVSAQVVGDRLGHADPGITLRVYAHLYEEQRREAAVSLASMLD